MMISIDTKSRQPIYKQIELQIIKLISLGVYDKQSALPSVRSLACELGINPNTVARAYKSLESNNIIYTIGGKGVFVSAQNDLQIKAIAQNKLTSYLTEAKNAGITKSEAIDLINELWGEEND